MMFEVNGPLSTCAEQHCCLLQLCGCGCNRHFQVSAALLQLAITKRAKANSALIGTAAISSKQGLQEPALTPTVTWYGSGGV